GRGAVVAIARHAREASRLLGMGADEVLRAGEVSPATLTGALDRASARSAARLSREVHRGAHDDVEPALGELVAGLERRLSTQLEEANAELDLLASALGTKDEHAAEVRRALTQLRASVRQARGTSLAMRSLSSHTAVEPEPVGQIVVQAIDILRPQL